MTYEEEKAKLEAEILEHVKAGRASEAVTAGEKLKQLEAEKAAREQQDRIDREASRLREQEKREADERMEREKKIYPEAWMRNIPLGRRFVILKMAGEYRSEYTCTEREKFDGMICPVDLCTKALEPYFGYYTYIGLIAGNIGEHMALEKLDLLRESTDAYAYLGGNRFNFFYIHRPEELTAKYAIVPWKINRENVEKAIREHGQYAGRHVLRSDLELWKPGKYKTLDEHLADLKREFGGAA